jgi:hypothetical protein
MNKIEVAPNVFLGVWSQVSCGYKHACGSFIRRVREVGVFST